MSEEQLIQSVVYGGNIARVTITTRVQVTIGLNKPIDIQYKYDEHRRFLNIIIKDFNGLHPPAGWINGGELKLGDQFRLDATTNVG